MQVLSIGNSFSADAQRYLHRIARTDGFVLNTCNLYIGGCSLETHHRNMLSEERAYELQTNGFPTGFKVSIKEALLNRKWDVITLQQSSPLSPKFESYQPFLDVLSRYVRTCQPKAKIAFHRTWAYQQESPVSKGCSATIPIRRCSAILFQLRSAPPRRSMPILSSPPETCFRQCLQKVWSLFTAICTTPISGSADTLWA